MRRHPGSGAMTLQENMLRLTEIGALSPKTLDTSNNTPSRKFTRLEPAPGSHYIIHQILRWAARLVTLMSYLSRTRDKDGVAILSGNLIAYGDLYVFVVSQGWRSILYMLLALILCIFISPNDCSLV